MDIQASVDYVELNLDDIDLIGFHLLNRKWKCHEDPRNDTVYTALEIRAKKWFRLKNKI